MLFRAHEQRFADLAVGPTVRDESKHLQLPSGQPQSGLVGVAIAAAVEAGLADPVRGFAGEVVCSGRFGERDHCREELSGFSPDPAAR